MDASSPESSSLPSEAADFYRQSIRALQEADVPFLVGGAYAFACYTGITRHTKDMDVFVRRADLDRALSILDSAGCRTSLRYSHWLARAQAGDYYVDLIFSSGNGVVKVDDSWFEPILEEEVFGLTVRVCPPEEVIWSKAYIMERERYDGADVAHLLLGCAEDLDGERLLERFGPHWRVLLAHLVLFGFTYPSERDRLPQPLMQALLRRLQEEEAQAPPSNRICRGTLLSRAQYLVDVEDFGYRDARLRPHGELTAEEIETWTAAIDVANRPP